MSNELMAIIGVGVALLGVNLRMYTSLRNDINDVKERLARLEGQVELLIRGLRIEIGGQPQ